MVILKDVLVDIVSVLGAGCGNYICVPYVCTYNVPGPVPCCFAGSRDYSTLMSLPLSGIFNTVWLSLFAVNRMNSLQAHTNYYFVNAQLTLTSFVLYCILD